MRRERRKNYLSNTFNDNKKNNGGAYEQNQNEHLSQEAIRIHHLVKQLNQYRHEYYNMNAPSVSDAVYDCLFDELDALEKRTGIILSNSPTQTVGYQAVSQLDKVHHSDTTASLLTKQNR